MHYSFVTLLLLPLTNAFALPEPAKTTSSNLFCTVVDDLVAIAKAQSTATAYCSSYLSIKTVTISTSTQTVTAFPTSYSCTPSAVAVKKVVQKQNEKRNIAKPPCFSSYTVSSLISSACSCLSIPTPTTSLIATSTATATSFTILDSATNGHAIAGLGIAHDPIAFSEFYEALVFNLYTGDGVTCGLQSTYPGSTTPSFVYVNPGSAGSSSSASDPSVIFDNNAGADSVPITCNIDTTTNLLTCSDPEGSLTTVSLAGLNWLLGDGSVGAPSDLIAVPVIQ